MLLSAATASHPRPAHAIVQVTHHQFDIFTKACHSKVTGSLDFCAMGRGRCSAARHLRLKKLYLASSCWRAATWKTRALVICLGERHGASRSNTLSRVLGLPDLDTKLPSVNNCSGSPWLEALMNDDTFASP